MRARREELGDLAPVDAYRTIRDEAGRGDFGAVPAGEGWLHEDFHLADKDAVFAAARAGGRIGAGDLVAASRLYTPRPIVDLILQNTLGALWLEMHPDSPLADRWTLLSPAATGPRAEPRPLRELRVADPCCGAGAFLIAALGMLRAMAADERRAAASGAVPASWCLDFDAVDAHIVGSMLWGADLDAAAVALTRAELSAAANGSEAVHVMVVEPPLGSLDPAVWRDEHFDVVCTNPPWIGFRQLDAGVKDAVRAAVPMAAADLAVATQVRCQDLAGPAGRIGTVTPASWLAGRPAHALRRRILREGGPALVAQLGQGVFDGAPLVFVAATVVRRGGTPRSFTAVRGRAGPEARDLAAVMASGRDVPTDAVAALPLLPFVGAAPAALLRLGAGRTRRIGDVATTFDGVWTGDNRRDLRFWWELDERDGWVPVSGGQGYQAWVAPTHLCIRAADVAAQPGRDGCLEYARVAGGRLGVRRAAPATAALAGVVTIVPAHDDPALAAEILAVCNGRVGAAWVATLAAGLNFNPGYLAEIPLGAGPCSDELVEAVDAVVALRGAAVARDPSHIGFDPTTVRWEFGPAPALAEAQERVDDLVARHLGLSPAVTTQLPPPAPPRPRVRPEDDPLLVAVLSSLGFTWPGEAARTPTALAAEDLVAVVADAASRLDLPVDARGWATERLDAVLRRRFRGRPPVVRRGGNLTLGSAAAPGPSRP